MPKKSSTASSDKPKRSASKKRGPLKRVLRILLFSALAFVGGSVLWVLLYAWLPVPGTPLMLIRKWENRSDKNFQTRYEWVPREKISPHLQLAVVCAEDQNYLKHNGLDFGAIEKAQKQNEKAGRIVRGASTISQQTAKNAFLWQGRSWLRKGLEVWFTFLIELFWSKERIMEVYLNIIEMGNGIYGAEAASRTYFKKGAGSLSAEQAALIAAVLPNPRVFSVAKPSLRTRERQAWVLQQMRFWGMKLDYDKYERQEAEPEKPASRKRKKAKG